MTAEPAEAERNELSVGEPSMRLLEFVDRLLPKSHDCSFGDARIAFADLERIAATVDQLNAKCESPLVDEAPDAIERHIIRAPDHGLGERPGELRSRGWQLEAGGIEKPFKKLG